MAAGRQGLSQRRTEYTHCYCDICLSNRHGLYICGNIIRAWQGAYCGIDSRIYIYVLGRFVSRGSFISVI